MDCIVNQVIVLVSTLIVRVLFLNIFKTKKFNQNLKFKIGTGLFVVRISLKIKN